MTWGCTPMVEGKNQPTPEHVRAVHPPLPNTHKVSKSVKAKVKKFLKVPLKAGEMS